MVWVATVLYPARPVALTPPPHAHLNRLLGQAWACAWE